MKIYTKTGDKGETSLLGGKRVAKSHLRIEAYGTVDELNAFIGLLRDQKVNLKRSDFIKTIQDQLFTVGAMLAHDPEKTRVKGPSLSKEEVKSLEKAIDEMEKDLQPLRQFVLPGGHEYISCAHIARTVCRRAERCVVALNEQSPVEATVLEFLNRLSDYLFVLGRQIAKELEIKEVTWAPRA